MEESMAFKAIDIEQLSTSFEEIINIEKEIICSSCKQSLRPIIGKEHLLKCNNCSKFMLAKTTNVDSRIVILIGKIIH